MIRNVDVSRPPVPLRAGGASIALHLFACNTLGQYMRSITNRRSSLAALGAALLLGLSLLVPVASAHDIPNQIRLQGFVKPEGDTLHFLVRVPLVMLLNQNLPKRGPGFLALEHLDDGLERATAATAREIVLYQDGEPLAYQTVTTRISPPSDRSFASFEQALETINGPSLPPETDVFWNQGYFDAHFRFPISSPDADFALDLRVAPGLRNRLTMILHFLPAEGAERVYELHYGTGPVHLDPSWYRAGWTFGKLGFEHILSGFDHLLFLLCLIVPFRMKHLWSLVAVITSFTIAHSITLSAAALGLVPQGAWFPPLVELLIALSIVYMAIENVVQANLRHRWIITGLFGLIHGFGFSFVLQEDLQLAGSHLLLSLLSFNIGVEVGQLVFLLAVLPVLGWLFRTASAERYGLIIISVLVGHTAWHWTLERFDTLRQIPSPGPEEMADLVLLAWGIVLTVSIAALWIFRHGSFRRSLSHRRSEA